MEKFWMIVNIAGGNGSRPVETLDDDMRPKAMYYNQLQAERAIVHMAKKIPSGNFVLLEAVEVSDESIEAAL